MPKLDFDHKNKLLEKSLKIGMKISSIKEGDLNFRFEETCEDKDSRLALIHFPSQKMLPREV